MIAQSSSTYVSTEEYLELEQNSPEKHEYIDGLVYAMAGTTDTHNIIVGNLYLLIRNHLRGSNCRVYFSDLKVRLEKRNCFYYPDLLVTCTEQDLETSTYKRFPKLIIEVLSDSTEAFDRGNKFTDYQTLDSLEEYVLINTTRPRLDSFQRDQLGKWSYQSYGDEIFDLNSINFTWEIKQLYLDT
ncbi:Uma2 family endonuclease [Thermosynechococcaceae cyanobacterium BACA0444]|uniref:Uma2 family endonuclease n=1 Tax=Pseudocalidococcus azoricus BACA0444 TaxID=2918990 RepID=A0AAE4FWL6_9CYAN|nr:Uma2 family endonuclease [Pseudocalidococcus azoricus]MDS3862315.1 Uma2 family endonuclease [Pseudocalidococcus azoricus BACA0444]